MAKTDTIKIIDLHVNTENYRFEPVGSQKEAIDTIVDDQGDKLYRLAEDIIKNGLNPNDRIQVVVSNQDPKKFNVLEGNRRTVALKIISNPDLLDSSKYSQLKRKFKKLHDASKGNLIKEVECTIYETASDADKWIKLKHAGEVDGIGTVRWNGQQVQRFEEKVEGKSSIALQAIKLLQSSTRVPMDMKSELKNLKITNLDRLISDPDVRDFLGIEVGGGIIRSETDQSEVMKGLTRIARDLLNPKFKVAQIYTKEDRRDYLRKFPSAFKPDTTLKATKPWQFNGSTSSAASPKAKLKAHPKDRDSLIPKSCVMAISNPKMNSIYHEFQKLSLARYGNVVAVAFRVFIENSMDCFIESNRITKTKNGRPLSKDSTLITKITEVANYLEANSLADKHTCKGIRNAAGNKNDLLGIDTLHAYVHNSKFRPTPQNLLISWDNIQPFIEKVWENVK